ncbi:hypothetical protein HPB47_021590 [Ixodes persulcatus]|uniref:Uncharacterized protein n=1 Tax=Ixodes persulcatus TaxID=34615 RepID=A0AC60QCD9_IXOPE|nr:hypothetical protein HPB47_021590 [Ixodes persulcatus]
MRDMKAAIERELKKEYKDLKSSIDFENLPAALKTLGDVIGEQIAESDIDVYHRMPRKDGGCPNIVVQFHSRAKRDEVIEGARKKRVCTTDLGKVFARKNDTSRVLRVTCTQDLDKIQ